MKILIIIIVFTFLFIKAGQSQCIDRDILWHRIIYLRDSTKISTDQELKELLSYLNNIDQCSYHNDSIHALLLRRVGWLYSLQKDFLKGIYYTKKSISLINEEKEKKNPSVNADDVISIYWNLHIIYDSLKLEKYSSDAMDSCIFIALTLNSKYDYALLSLIEKIQQLFEIGDYYNCITYAKLGETIIRENTKSIHYADYFDRMAFTYKINSLIFLNKPDEVENSVVRKIEIAERNNDVDFLTTLYALQASVLRGRGKLAEASAFFKKSFDASPDNLRRAEALNNIGYIYLDSLQQNDKAIIFFLKALKFSGADETLNIYDNIANIYVRKGNYDSAFYFFDKAFEQISPNFKETDLLRVQDAALEGKTTEYITGTLLDKGDAYLSKYNTTGYAQALTDALNVYKTADIYFDKIRSSQADIQSQLFWKANNRRLYEHAVEACYARNDINMAFYFFEKNRSVLLNEEIKMQRAMSSEDVHKKAQLINNIEEIEEKLKSTIYSSTSSKLEIQLFIYTHALEMLIKTNNTKQFSYQNNSDTSFITIAQLRKNIVTDSKSLLEIFNGDSAVYVLTITNNNQSLHKINKSLYDSLTNSFISSIRNRYILNKHFNDFINTSHKLYKLLFQNVIPGNTIIISPDGKGFPFEALVMNENIEQPDYLLKYYAISYTYSAKYLTNRFASNTGGHSILGIAPVQYNSHENLAELSGSDGSLKIINGYFKNVKSYTYEHATMNNFLQNFPSCSIIQLYTHASETSSNNDPVIYFSDSALYLSSLIPGRKPVTQLVVLSACETANGKLYEGEGVFSFNRAFASLGIPAAISNLWSVDNVSTYTITELFYKYLSRGLPTDVALQKAKLEFINNSSSEEKKLPYFWAASILTGKVDIIKTETAFPWLKATGTALVILILMYLLYKFFKTSRSNKI